MDENESTYSKQAIVEAIETLSVIADLDMQSDIGIAAEHHLTIQGSSLCYRTIHWLQAEDLGESVEHMRAVFRAVLDFLEEFCRDEEAHIHELPHMTDLRDVMLLVGDAAQKLDRFLSVFDGRKAESVTKLPEFRHLQEFYERHIAKRDSSLALGHFVPGNVTRRGAKISLARRKAIKSRLVSLDHARRDLDYELFFMMKESGGHYYSPELLRNLHLVSDFSSHFGFKSGRDPLARVQIWRDRHRHGTARDILTTVHRYTREFHKNYNRYRKTDFAKRINFTVMALMMAANPRNLLRNAPSKCCSEYFQDFLNLFRELLQSKRYESMIHTPSHHRNEDYWAQMELIHHLGRALFTRGQGLGQVRSVLSYFREDYGNIAPQEDFAHLPITKALDATYRMMRTVSAHHPDGPLNRLLEELEVKQFRGFDPLHQGNIPSRLFSLFYGNDTVAFARLACPTRQMRVDRASVLEEFKTSLRVSHRDTTPRKHLIINLQDRTNWRELHRSLALENLPLESDFKKYIAVVTLGRNTDFYHQLAPYHDQDDYEGFKQVFHEQLISMDTGYHFPAFVKKDLTMKVLLGLMDGIHAVFFNKKANLDRSERLNFIELYHLFLSVKCIDIIHPCSCSFVCKDSLDLSPCMSAALRILLTMLNEGELKDEELQDIEALVNVPVLLVRERMIQPQVHDRFLKVVECIERSRREATSAQAFLSSVTRNFSDFYDKPLIRGSYFRSPRPAQPW